MTTEAMIGHGTLFEILDLDQSPPAYVAVAEIVNVQPPQMSRDALDATHAESTNKWREFIPGLRDGGEVSLEMNFIPKGAGTLKIISTFNSDLPVTCRISFPDGDPDLSPPTASQWTFTGICTAFSPSAPFDNKMSASATFKVSGAPTFVAGA